MKPYFFLLVLAIISSACTTQIVRTSSFPRSLPLYDTHSPNSLFNSPRIGVPYYLPKALIPITITLNKPSPNPKPGAPTPTSQGNTTIIINPPGGDPQSSSAKTGTQTSASLISEKVGPYQVTIGNPQVVPDMSNLFYLEYNAEAATQDVVTFGVGANQLLQSINATSTDKSGEALVTLAKIAADIAMLAKKAQPPSQEPSTPCKELEPIEISTYLDPTEFDPTSPDQANVNPVPFSLSALKKLLNDKSVPLEFIPTPLDSTSIDYQENQTQLTAMKSDDTKKTGVLFRVLEAYQLEISFKSDTCLTDEPSKTLQTMLMIPSKKKIYSLDVNRGALITKMTNLTIVDGMLNKIEINKPSSLLGVLNVPLDIIKAVLSAPAELLTLRLQKIQAEGNITKTQADKLNSELEKLKNTILIQNAQHSSQ